MIPRPIRRSRTPRAIETSSKHLPVVAFGRPRQNVAGSWGEGEGVQSRDDDKDHAVSRRAGHDAGIPW